MFLLAAVSAIESGSTPSGYSSIMVVFLFPPPRGRSSPSYSDKPPTGFEDTPIGLSSSKSNANPFFNPIGLSSSDLNDPSAFYSSLDSLFNPFSALTGVSYISSPSVFFSHGFAIDYFTGFFFSFSIPLFSTMFPPSLFSFLESSDPLFSSFLITGFFGNIRGLGLKLSGGYSPSANSGIVNFVAPPRGRLSFGSSLNCLSIFTNPSSASMSKNQPNNYVNFLIDINKIAILSFFDSSATTVSSTLG